MPKFRVYLRQWVEEIATIEVEAENKEAAIKAVENGDALEFGYDEVWSDGSDTKDFEIMDAEKLED
jgi:hypothetical protein